MKRKILACLLSLSLLILTIAPAAGSFASEVEPAPTVLEESSADVVETSVPEETEDATASPAPEPTPDPTPEPTLEPAPDPSPDPTAEPTPEPTSESTLESIPDLTPEPTPEPTPAPEMLSELRVDVQANAAGAFEGEEIGACAFVSGGLAPYSVQLIVETGENVLAEQTIVLEAGGSASIHVAAVYGTACFTARVTDALGGEASGSAQTRVARHASETRAQWEATVRGVQLSGDWREDVPAVARTQLGYRESDCDFIIDAEGNAKGYTRYGDWYGADYDDWCAMFVAFCLHYAGISRSEVPWDASCERFRGNLRSRGAYVRADEHDPQSGDLIFFRDADGSGAGHMGVVTGADGSTVRTIEGNSANQVRAQSYSLHDKDILGYGDVAELMRQAGVLEEEAEEIDATPTPTTSAEPDITPAPSAEPDATSEPSIEPDTTPATSAEPEFTPEPSIEPELTPAPSAEPDATPEPSTEPDTTPAPVIDAGGTVLVEPSSFVPVERQLYESTASLRLDGSADSVQDAILPQFGRLELSASGSGSAQWQILLPGAQVWVDVAGETSPTLSLTYAKVRSLLSGGTVRLRCAFGSGDSAAYSATARVAVRYGAAEKDAVDAAADAPAVMSLRRSAAVAYASEEPAPTYTAVINYVFASGEIVAEPYTATLAAGSDFSAEVPNPTILGYLPYVDGATESAASVQLNITNIQADVTHTVVYLPTNVDYTVIHYRQNLSDDSYAEYERETKQGLTGSSVPDAAKSYAGFYALLYDRPAIAADGSTVVEVYYDRCYYLMNFDLGGGYGVEPIYARYGAPIGDVGEPIRAGYTFEGWSLNGAATSLPATMPAENRSYAAIWKMNDAARLTVVFWGENADDEEYSYIKSSEVYVQSGTEFTYDEEGALVCVLEPHAHELSECYEQSCAQQEHTHSEECYACGITSHTHDTGCYAGVGDRRNSPPNGAPGDPASGQVYEGNRGRKYIYIGGAWYGYTGASEGGSIAPATCGMEENAHVHSDACLGCGKTEHVHSVENGCYHLICGKAEHLHTSACYMNGAGLDSNLWTFVRSETVTVAPDGSSVVNVYYDRTSFTLTFRANDRTVATITEKWGADISGEFNKPPFSTTYNGRAWECTESSKYGYALQTLDRMPQFDATFVLYNQSSETLKTIYYYVENVGANVPEDSWPTGAAGFTLLKTVQTYFNYATYEEEYHEIDGFTRYPARVAGFNNDNQKNFSNNALELYYLRNDYVLTFNDGFENVRSETVQYQAPLGAYSDYLPEVPAAYESDSVSFGGWYLNPECNGEEYVLDAHTMPLGNLLLYARWKPVTHTVSFYLNRDAREAGELLEGYEPRSVLHGALLGEVEPPENGSYVFVGWFLMDGGVEKAFDPENMPVTGDLEIYGKWSSNTLKRYAVYYRLQGTDTDVAAPTLGSALAGSTRTFAAKGGDALYPAYQSGYFPTVRSHSITLDIEDDASNSYTFWYVERDAVPYTVRYLDADTGEPVAAEKTVSDNRQAVVTESFVPVSGMLPDAYQKRLVLCVDENGNPDAEGNLIVFYYTRDTVHAYYKITHYIQTVDGANWQEHASSQATGTIGEIYSASPMTIPGFSFDETVDGTRTGGELTAGGLELKLYYSRNAYPYEVRYLESGTLRQLAEPKMGSALYQSVVSEDALEIPGYEALAPTSQTLTVRIEQSATEAKLNRITFYYARIQLASLTIRKSIRGAVESDACFLFHVSGGGIDLDVLVRGSGTATIDGLTVGETYTVREISGNWRYDLDTSGHSVTLEPGGSTVTVNNTHATESWLDDNAYSENKFSAVTNAGGAQS